MPRAMAIPAAALIFLSAAAAGGAAAAPLRTPTGACAVPCNKLTPQDVVKVDYVDLDSSPGFQRTTTLDAGRTLTIRYRIVINPAKLPPGSHIVLMVVPSWTPSYPPPSGYYKVIYDGVPQQEVTLEGSVLLRTPGESGTFKIWIVYGGVGDVSRFLEVWAQTSPSEPGCRPHAEVTLRAVARVRVADMSVNPREVEVGGEVVVRATLVNDGTAPADEQVRVYVDGGAAGTKRIHLDPGDSEVVTFRLTMGEPGDHQVTVGDRTQVVHVLGGPNIEVSGLIANETSIYPGGKVAVTVTVANLGESEGEATLKLFVDGSELSDQRRTVTVQPASSLHETWVIRLDEPGDHEIRVNNLRPITVHVITPGSCEIVDLSLERDSVVVGSSVNATVVLSNPGETGVRCPVSIELNGSGVGAREVEVPPESSVNVTFRFLPPRIGVYLVSAGNETANLVVSPPAEAEEREILPPGSEPILLGAASILGGVGALVGVRKIWRWRRSRRGTKPALKKRRVPRRGRRAKKAEKGGRAAIPRGERASRRGPSGPRRTGRGEGPKRKRPSEGVGWI